MTLSTHVNNMCRSACLAIYKIGQIRRFIDQSTAERLVHAFVTSQLDTNNSLLYGLPGSQIAKLQRVQNIAIRMITCIKGNYDINVVRREVLHWLPIKDRIVFKILLIIYKALHGLAPSYISDLLTNYTPRRTLRSSSLALLQPPTSREVSTSYYGNRVFSVAAPKLWNNIPLTIRKADSLAKFKHLLKTYLFKNPTV